MGKLDGKVAVVIGGSKGIGAAAAKHLAAEGASVVVNFRASKLEADRVVSEIVSAGGKAIAVCADVSDEKAIAELFAKTKEVYGKLDILVNNAGVYAFGPIRRGDSGKVSPRTQSQRPGSDSHDEGSVTPLPPRRRKHYQHRFSG
jgi:3-oxoacyl-[acyl-carrier protein] reductase